MGDRQPSVCPVSEAQGPWAFAGALGTMRASKPCRGGWVAPSPPWKWLGLGLWFLSEARAEGRSSVIEDNYEVSHPVGADGRAWLLPL